jgi:hypothetical protein
MNKPMLLAAAMTALSISGGAMALDVSRQLTLSIPGFYGRGLGEALLTPVGRSGGYCDYEMSWQSPFNPNDVARCLAREARTPVSPSCIENELRNIVTTVTAGVDSACCGFNVKGERFDGVVLILGESPAGLVGTAHFPVANSLPYPITTCSSML